MRPSRSKRRRRLIRSASARVDLTRPVTVARHFEWWTHSTSPSQTMLPEMWRLYLGTALFIFFFSENRRDRRRIGLVTFDFFSVFIFLLEPSPCNGYHWSVRRKDGDKKNVLHSTWKGSVDRGRRPKSWARARFRQLRYMRYYGSLFEPYPNGKVLGRCKTAN